jgi:hypothetical protein
MIKGGDERSISAVLRAIVRKHGLEHELYMAELREHWPSIVGNKMANSTDWMKWKDGTLTIKMNNSVGRNELFYLREPMTKRINEQLEAEFVREIVIL